MLDSKDLLKVGGVVAGVAALAAVGFAIGYVAARDPKALRRWAGAAAGGLERLQMALAETREEIADLWAEARAQARADLEEKAMAAAEATAGAATAAHAAASASVAAAEDGAQQEAPVAAPAAAPPARSPRRPRRTRAAASPSHH